MTGYGVGVPLKAHKDGKIVGYYYPWKNIYEKRVDWHLHRSFKEGGWGIQKSLVEELKKRGCEVVRMLVRCDDEHFILHTMFLNYLRHGSKPTTLNKADGPQIFLADKYWKTK